MAVDTQGKRYSMVSFGDCDVAMRVPDATDMDEAGDRQNEVYLYSGFDAGEPPVGGDFDYQAYRQRRIGFVRRRGLFL